MDDTRDTLAGRMMAASAIVFGGALLIILTAHTFEHIGGYAPCPLCLQERYAYYFGVPAAVVAFLAARAETFGFARLVLLLIAIGFLLNMGLGVYHAGAEWKFWPGPETCAGGFDLTWSQEGIVDTPVIRCDEAAWRFLGLSFAGWNAVVSAALAAIALWGAALRR
ncbi:disulfide bond formation protein B [Methyloceanibacter caenitepidi]|uniref:Periplasmic thiol:disulfide oxidoreductase DsbB n=1 Tax=Methyloceanibacter caenitepidi TaxID=1384459 RepID=A0A0A8K8B6_9HYPH|nr:disulfide bond formation protein B [Methyloceanibacter caenitepidi]BAQ18772.1 periplasmic thiol:disulfide oxidoreductase DsbB [Methyloceanibacter caenitepidi]